MKAIHVSTRVEEDGWKSNQRVLAYGYCEKLVLKSFKVFRIYILKNSSMCSSRQNNSGAWQNLYQSVWLQHWPSSSVPSNKICMLPCGVLWVLTIQVYMWPFWFQWPFNFCTTHKQPYRRHGCGSQFWQISYWMIFQAWWAIRSPGHTLMRCSQQLHAIFSSTQSSVIKQCKKCWRTQGLDPLTLEGKVEMGNRTTG